MAPDVSEKMQKAEEIVFEPSSRIKDCRVGDRGRRFFLDRESPVGIVLAVWRNVMAFIVQPAPHGRRDEIQSPKERLKKVDNPFIPGHDSMAQLVSAKSDAGEAVPDHKRNERPINGADDAETDPSQYNYGKMNASENQLARRGLESFSWQKRFQRSCVFAMRHRNTRSSLDATVQFASPATNQTSRVLISISDVRVRWTGHLLAISTSLERCSSVSSPSK